MPQDQPDFYATDGTPRWECPICTTPPTAGHITLRVDPDLG